MHHRHDGIGEGQILLRVHDVGDGQILADHHQRHVAHHLGGRRHLDDVAEHPVHVGIGLGHLVPARLQAQRAGLFL